ncbi:MAG: MarR family winged helix-turn-helix transcriptional regulator [Bacteroidia bacterium]
MTLEEQLKQKEFKTKRQRAYLNVVYTASVLNLEQTRLFKPFGLSLQQYNVLRILRGQNGTPVSIGLIQERMLDIQSNASRLIDKLEDKKLAIRKVCPNDKRQMEITITQEGLKVLLELDEVIVLNESNIQLTDGEADMLNDLLNKLRTNQKNK